MRVMQHIWARLPGVFISAFIAALAFWLSVNLNLSAMVFALFLGLLFHPYCAKRRSLNEGLTFSATTILKLGIICLGASVDLKIMWNMGWPLLLLILLTMSATTVAGLLLGKKLGLKNSLSVLITGAVAVCGTAAAMALYFTLPREKNSDRHLSLVLVGITIISTVGMVLYPLIFSILRVHDTTIGIIVGASLHNVAQSIASGFLVSPDAGETATLVKLARVSLLAPYILIISLCMGTFKKMKYPSKKTPFLPIFIMGFLGIACVNSAGLIPSQMVLWLIFVSKISLITSIAAIGASTSFSQFKSIDKPAINLLISLTIFLFVFSTGLVLIYNPTYQ